MRLYALVLSLVLLTSGSLISQNPRAAKPPQGPPTVAEAEQFIKHAEVQLNDLTVRQARAAWVQSNFITDDTEILAAEANEVLIGATTELAKQTTRYDGLKMPDELARKMLLLALPPPFPLPRPAIPSSWPRWPGSRRFARSRLRQGQVLPEEWQACRHLSRHWPDRTDHGQQHDPAPPVRAHTAVVLARHACPTTVFAFRSIVRDLAKCCKDDKASTQEGRLLQSGSVGFRYSSLVTRLASFFRDAVRNARLPHSTAA